MFKYIYFFQLNIFWHYRYATSTFLVYSTWLIIFSYFIASGSIED